MKGLLVHRAAEHRDDSVGEDEVQRREHKAARDRQYDRAADALFCLSHLALAERNADERAAAVADHHGDGERHDRERKDDGIGRVAVGTEVACVGDENLVDDVIERADEQRDDARDGIAPHELSHALRPQKLICVFHGGLPPAHKNKRCVPPDQSGLTHLCCTI